jgi:hypothetical protein
MVENEKYKEKKNNKRLSRFFFFELVACATSIVKQSHNALQKQTRGTKRPVHPKPEPSLTLSSCLNNTQKLQGHPFEHLFTIKHTLKKKEG